MGASTLSRDAFRFSDGVELKAATQVVCEHVQLLPGAIGGIAFSGHDVESELAAQFGEGFLLAARNVSTTLRHPQAAFSEPRSVKDGA